ncbi:glutathione transferase GST 23-like [Cornus florida]|uniref:glutathione transferase GST 23-like n=1 Tax=Cornus florida TaxID=4283 RepID=UPI00289B87C0|nr:glutathione transferase GST 23-like [Cornus florida]
MEEEVKLFRTWSSPFALRIVWALKLKGIEYETIFEDIANKTPLLLQYNPVYKKVPVLIHNEKPISESLVILEYIEETWKQTPSLLPEDPYEKAMARFWAKFADDKLMPSVWQVFLKQGKEQEEAIAPAIENLKFLEEELKGKKFFGGESIGFLDLTLGWMANLVSVLEEVTGLKLIDEENFPLLSAWMENFSDHPIIEENWPPHDKLVTKFQAIREAYLAAAAPK